ncbi:MAG: transposase [Candidatus Tectimicrobiota bacterium]
MTATDDPTPASESAARGQVLRPYLAYLIRRWREGCTDSMQLWRELREQGYTYSTRTVSRFMTRLRQAGEAGLAPETQAAPSTRPQGPSARAVAFTWVRPEAKRAPDAQQYVDHLIRTDPSIAQAYTLSQGFLALVRERRGEALTAWITEATTSGIAALARFAAGLQDDLAAMTAGLTLPWSNGPVEGQVHRLKLLKREGYGRAGVLLWRQRLRASRSPGVSGAGPSGAGRGLRRGARCLRGGAR